MSKLSDPSLTFCVPRATVTKSLEFLREKGMSREEGVLLWPGRLVGNTCEIADPIIPRQITGEMCFQIPDDETFRIVQEVAELGLVIPIQIHSHPRTAFHSRADDKYAFVQHENAISIVVPNFANLAPAEFLSKARFYRLLFGSKWTEMSKQEIKQSFRFQVI